jgi:hypothetical protein
MGVHVEESWDSYVEFSAKFTIRAELDVDTLVQA